jgi:membrane protein
MARADAASRDAKARGPRLEGPVLIAVAVAFAGAFLAGRSRGGHEAGGAANAPRRLSIDPGRGRHARTPLQLPLRAWWSVLKRTYREAADDRLLSVAAGIAFYATLALFPALAAFVSLYGLFADPATVRDHLAAASMVLPQDATGILLDQADRLAARSTGTLGAAFAIGLGVALWSANSGMKAVFEGLNVIYEEDEKRGFVKLNAVSLAFTLGAILFMLLAIAAVVVAPVVLAALGLGGDGTTTLLLLLRWPIFLVVVTGFLAVLYMFGPSRTRARWPWVVVGAAVAALLWSIGSAAFSYYLANFAAYGETYGSLGAGVGLLVWLWLSAVVVLAGAELNAESEHQTAMDTTAGREKPLGARGARMADEVA